MSDLTLDGNAIAATLADAFGADITGERRGCASCGAVNAVGAFHVYRGAGYVLRCPACGDVAVRIALSAQLRVTESWTR